MAGILIFGLLSFAGGGGTLPQSASACLVYPWEATAGPVTLAEDGEYAVWLCASPRDASSITIGGEKLDLPPADKEHRNKDIIWRKAGVLTLPAGPVEIMCGPDLALIAMSKQAGFNPENVLTDLFAVPLPTSARDARADIVRDTNTVFTMPHYTKETWEAKAALLRLRLLLGSGLYPLPEKTPLNAKIFDETAQDGYTVAKVHFEPWPGFLATGNLYRPLGDGPFPGTINPHGHWEHGRLEDGTERGSVPARCITLARMGAVAFSYDMIGYVDSKQTPHNWGGQRENSGAPSLALQLWTSIRAVDFITSLPYVDGSAHRRRRVRRRHPDVRGYRRGTAHPGRRARQHDFQHHAGRLPVRERAILRLDNSNMEIGALAAPRPMLMVSATGDWTRETPHVEFPAIRSIYALHGAEGNLENVHLDYGPNYNQASREAMYRFMGKHLIGGDWANYTEPAYVKPSDEVLRVFPEDKPPEGYLSGPNFIEMLIGQARDRRAARLAALKDGAITTEAFAALRGWNCPAQMTSPVSDRHGGADGYVLNAACWSARRGDRIPRSITAPRTPPQDASARAWTGRPSWRTLKTAVRDPWSKRCWTRARRCWQLTYFLPVNIMH